MFREKPAKNTVNMVGDGDDVDIVLDIEKTFGIQITEAEAEKIRTVGELYDLVCSKVDLEANGICLSGRAFRIWQPPDHRGPPGSRGTSTRSPRCTAVRVTETPTERLPLLSR